MSSLSAVIANGWGQRVWLAGLVVWVFAGAVFAGKHMRRWVREEKRAVETYKLFGPNPADGSIGQVLKSACGGGLVWGKYWIRTPEGQKIEAGSVLVESHGKRGQVERVTPWWVYLDTGERLRVVGTASIYRPLGCEDEN